MLFLLYALHVMICLFLILVVLLQQGKGADLSVFGGGGTMTAFGARGAATLLHKLTVGSFVAFIVTTLAIGVFQSRRDGSTVMTGVAAEPDPIEQVAPATGIDNEADGATEDLEPIPGAFTEDDAGLVEEPAVEGGGEPPVEDFSDDS